MTTYAEPLSRMKRLLWIIIISQILTSVFAQNTTHTVMRGETIFSIARQYSVTLDALVKRNNINDPSNVRIGTVLSIPHEYEPSDPLTVRYHTVMPGETYFGIARKYNLSVETLLAINHRTSSTILRVDEQLIVVNSHSAPTVSAPTMPVPPPIVPMAQSTISTPVTSATAQPVALINPGTVLWPVMGEISAHTGKQGGVQIHAKGESRVQAVASGVVVYVGSFRELGNLVLVERPGGYIYIYGGLSTVLVKQGDTVTPGISLGMLSGNGDSLVFSVFKDSNLISPQTAPRD
jgi:lipoprotein NlpD